ncbi:MAG: hypothetical protein R3B93_01300 [Bacteroidia bacterium]
MKLKKLSQIIGKDLKRYIPYALGELFLIVFGILVALYINNRNTSNQYEKQIDNNFQRVYTELEQNIETATIIINKLQEKDSLIYRVMSDSVKSADYYKDLNLAYLTLFYHNLSLEDKAFQNLINLAISDNSYQDELLNQLKELYSINENIKEDNKRMSAFVYEESLPFVAENTESFGDLTYQSQVKKDVVDFFMTSNEYKSYVSQYAIIAIKNQLRHNQKFLKMAKDVYADIGEAYGLKNDQISVSELFSYCTGTYMLEYGQYKDTIEIISRNDSLIFSRGKDLQMNLVHLSQYRFYTDMDGGGYFLTFNKDESNTEASGFRIHLLSRRLRYQRIGE